MSNQPGDPMRDPTSWDGLHRSNMPPFSETRRWVRAHSNTFHGRCPDCGHRMQAHAQYLAVVDKTLYRIGDEGVEAVPGDTHEQPPDWRALCDTNHHEQHTEGHAA